MSCKLYLAAAAMLATGACETLDKQTGSVDPGFGEALKYDMAIQTIDPDPVYPETAAKPGSLGTSAAAAAERYRKGTVKPVERISSGDSGPS